MIHGGRDHGRGALAAATLAMAMLTVDVTVVRVALPAMQGELDLSDVAQQWVVNAYLLALGVLVIAGGRAGDLLGRRRVFIAGLVLFTCCSALSGLAQSGALLIVARAGQGAGAAIMTPGTMAIVADAFSRERLGRAIGVLTGTAAIGLSLGPLLGGLLTELAGWRWIFFVNLPLGAIAVALTVVYVPARRPAAPPSLDAAGVVTLVVGVSALILALMQGGEWGWGAPATLALVAGGALALVAFASVERRTREPLVDLRLLRGASLAANGIGALSQLVAAGLTVLLAIYLQDALGFSPLAAGLALLPVTLPVLAIAPAAGRLLARAGARALVAGGMALLGAGLLGAAAGVGSGYEALVPGLLLFGVGFALVVTAMTTAVMAGAGAADRGMVSGVYNTARNIGASVGVAALGAVLLARERSELAGDPTYARMSAAERADVDGLLAGAPSARALVARLDPSRADAIGRAAADALEAAFATTLWLMAIAGFAGALAALALPAGRGRHSDDPRLAGATGGVPSRPASGDER